MANELPLEEANPPTEKKGRKVIADERLSAANEIMRILGEMTASERNAVMQIVNILVDNKPPAQNEE